MLGSPDMGRTSLGNSARSTGNQQGKFPQEWLAGFWDAEGSVCMIRRTNTDGGLLWSPLASVVSTDLECLQAVREALGSVPHYVAHLDRGFSPYWLLQIAGLGRTRKFLDHIGPLLQVKKGLADTMGKFLGSRHGKKAYTAEEERWIEQLRRGRTIVDYPLGRREVDPSLAWLAGFFDGEGSVSSFSRPSGRQYWQLRIANASALALGVVTEICDAHDLPYKVYYRKPSGVHRKPMWDLMVQHVDGLARWKAALEPHCIVKRDALQEIPHRLHVTEKGIVDPRHREASVMTPAGRKRNETQEKEA
jgi:hypothetical protein